jgi:hypothetical protein
MTSPTINAPIVWHVRPSGNNANGGAGAVLLDDGIVNAGCVTRHGDI